MLKTTLKTLVYLAFILSGVGQAAPVVVDDNISLEVQCANGRYAPAAWGCPAGQELQDPVLNFTDLISGPDTGLGDGLGSGAIVTVWGQNLGSSQGSSTIEYCDSLSVCRAGHVYYWKNADGQLPSGPANLYESHKMQEIAFSIPDSALGNGRIKVVVGGQEAVTNTGGDLAFTVRAGNIYHVASGGSNSNSCSWLNPCEYINGDINPSSGNGGKGNAGLEAGDIVYSRGVQEPFFVGSGGVQVGLYLRGINGTIANQIAMVAYPTSSGFSQISALHRGQNNYLTEGVVTSKYKISVGYANPENEADAGSTTLSNYHLDASKNGRSVANHMIQNDGLCFTGWKGAITSGGDEGHNFKALGNHIENLGCDNSSRYAHTLYMGLRSDTANVTVPWEISYNYLDNNNLLHGIHNYDETYNGDCGTLTGLLKINNNVIINQRGYAINVAASDYSAPINFCWAADIEVKNNIIINAGQGVAQESNKREPSAMNFGGGMNTANLTIENNTVFGWGEESSFTSGGSNEYGYLMELAFDLADPLVVLSNNTFVQTTANEYVRWIQLGEPNISGTNNNFWNAITDDGNSAPSYTGNIIADPLLTVTDAQIRIGSASPLINSGSLPSFEVDIYGEGRGTTVGAVQ